jgi:hypothetical protein
METRVVITPDTLVTRAFEDVAILTTARGVLNDAYALVYFEDAAVCEAVMIAYGTLSEVTKVMDDLISDTR